MDKQNTDKKKLKRKRIAALVLIAGFIIAGLLIYFIWGRPLIRFVSDPDEVRSFETENPVASRIAYVLLMAVQVIIAVIPGEPLEVGAGYAFGAIEGTLICLAGITLGSILVFLAVKRYGRSVVELFFSPEKIDSIRIFKNLKKLNTIAFIVFLIPGTPKDLLTYVAGLTPIRLRSWIFITAVARLPSVITSTIAGDAISEQRYWAAGIVFGVTALLAVIGYVVWYRLNLKDQGDRR